MDILFFCPRWGHAQVPMNEFARKVKDAGYDGIETDIPTHEKQRDVLLEILEKNNLLLIAQHWETIEPDFEKHLEAYTEQLAVMALAKPLFINSQTGKDYYTFTQNEALIRTAEMTTALTGIPVHHETHRGKFSFAAHVIRKYIDALPLLTLTLDISHWCVVAETLLHDQADAVAKAISRTKHIHARIGATQTAQVTDPRLPEWEDALQFHLSCWDSVVEQNQKEGNTMLTFTTEFGPYPYMINLPSSGKPVTDQWDINVYMKDLLKKRYKK